MMFCIWLLNLHSIVRKLCHVRLYNFTLYIVHGCSTSCSLVKFSALLFWTINHTIGCLFTCTFIWMVYLFQYLAYANLYI